MPVKLIEEKEDGTIHPSRLKDGQIAVITSWIASEYVGQVVCRQGGCLFSMNGRSKFWDDSIPNMDVDRARVRVLPNGTKLEIVDNE